MTKIQKIQQLKEQYPTLQKSVNGEISQLDNNEYETTINNWADAELIQEAEIAAAKAKAQAKAQAEAKLLALGLSTDDLAALGLAQSL